MLWKQTLRQRGWFQRCIVLSMIALLPACARPGYPSLSASAIANQQKAYLYGRFWVDRPWGHAGRLALELEDNTGGQILRLRLRDHGPVYAVEVEPGTYRIKDILYDSAGMFDWETSKIRLIEPAYVFGPFTAKAGKAYYLGDFDGNIGYGGTGYPLFSLVPVAVRFSANFDKTSELVKEAVPALKILELVRAWEEMP